MAKPETDPQVRLFTAGRMYADLLRPGSAEQAIATHVSGMIRDEDFDAMYKEGGRPPVSPRILTLVTVLQTLDRLPDREAAYDVRVRLDWQVILGVEPGWEGFDASLLSVFRQRLLEHPEVKDVFDRVLERLKELKLVRPEGRQRLDSTWVFGLLALLSRIENVKEALRLALRAIAEAGKEGRAFVEGVPGAVWRRAMRKLDLRGIEAEERQVRTLQFGRDAALVLERLKNAPEALRELPEVVTLRKIFEQNFAVEGTRGRKKSRKRRGPDVKLRDFRRTPGTERISTPHEPEARYNSEAHKRDPGIGYKIQVAETAKRTGPNFLTAVEVTCGARPDTEETEPMVAALRARGLRPKDLHVDAGYVLPRVRQALRQKYRVRLLGPTRKQAQRGMTSDKTRAPIERTLRNLVAHGGRHTRYRGTAKTRAWERMVGVVVNLTRLGRAMLEGVGLSPPKGRRLQPA